MKGRPAKPTEQHQREGTWRPDRHALPVVLAARGVPDKPEHLSEEAAGIWDLLIADLAESGVLDKTDALAVEAVAVTLERARQARRLIAEEGMTIESARGAKTRHPAVQIERDCWALLRGYMEQLGLSPAARARLGLTAIQGMTAAQTLAARLGENPLDQPPDDKDKQPTIEGELVDEKEDD